MSSLANIDTGLNTAKGQNYLNKQEKLFASLSSSEETIIEDYTDNTVAISTVPAVTAKSPAKTDTNNLVELLGLTNSVDNIEISIQVPAKTGEMLAFSIQLKPTAINISDDCITVLIPADINIKPPALVPLTVKKSGITYPVVYAGTMLQTPKINLLAFLRSN